ncbi:zinc-binding dehydrogenase [Jongsikchunia kroppenstedtii]|uniref:zinc-binding dehydrogenase n=1 Tax=Jongsikchunia kroppenstedtii TaxID=1121721 RepID=UPI00036891C3|nr:zinc-binding dehydrogenase [Jongsikchunia kroppenstedtii]
MHAIVAEQPGPADVLTPIDLPDPEPGPGQVRVAVSIASITFVETMIRAGSPVAPPAQFPFVPGNGVGGAVDRVGADVDPAWLGTEVATTTGGRGGYANMALADVADLHRIPAGLELGSAVALLADGRTAVGLFDAAQVGAGDVVVVTAAAGGVGGILVQLCVAAGARVIGLAGNAGKLGHATDLGAHAAINYRDTDWVEQLRAAAPHGVDVVFDGIGGDTTEALYPETRSGGRYLQHGAASGRWKPLDETAARQRDVTVIGLNAIGVSGMFDFTERAFELGASGRIRPTVGQVFRLDDAALAHAAIEARAVTGKTLLLV